jgi:hypothetical protein
MVQALLMLFWFQSEPMTVHMDGVQGKSLNLMIAEAKATSLEVEYGLFKRFRYKNPSESVNLGVMWLTYRQKWPKLLLCQNSPLQTVKSGLQG